MDLRDAGFFEVRGLEVLVFCNWYDGLFSDAKMAGIELIHHGVRTVTNGDVRLGPVPGQWDPVPRLVDRRVDRQSGTVEVTLEYPFHGFSYRLCVDSPAEGVRIRVMLDAPLPPALEGSAGFNLEFLPAAYFGASWHADGKSGMFPRYPSGSMVRTGNDSSGGSPAPCVPEPLASGRAFVLAPEDPERMVSVSSPGAELSLYDGRNTAQNGWFVLRSILPGGRTGTVAEWFLSGAAVPGWTRKPVIAHSQAGYHPERPKQALVELDRNDPGTGLLRVLRASPAGGAVPVCEVKPEHRVPFLRYDYCRFDFSRIRDEGVYLLEYAGVRTAPFRVAADVYENAWHPTLDVFFPVQMDHMAVREAYRVWHGVCHLDDARQAPPGHEHFDLYAQGPETDTPFRAGEHIPGLNVGGWFDAGDYDIRTQSQYAVVLDLVHVWERFRPLRDQTTVDRAGRYVELHAPDGVPDLIQQLEHGALALLAQHRAVGHAIPGIVEPDLRQYTHLGDASTKTDNRVYDSALKPGEERGDRSGIPDDRWAFTSHSTPLNLGSAAALAAASRALAGYSDLADECREVALRTWAEEQSHPPVIFAHGNTTGGNPADEEFRAAVELLVTTGDSRYAGRLRDLEPALEDRFLNNAPAAVRALPCMDAEYAGRLESRVRRWAEELRALSARNPFGVPISRGGWAGNGGIIRFALACFELHSAFPGIIGPEPVFRAFEYLTGCHPDSDISFVSGVGARSKETAYGSNRADFSFIAGGVVPGVLILNPDYPENKENWPFLWGENEYVINEASGFLYLVHALDSLVHGGADR